MTDTDHLLSTIVGDTSYNDAAVDRLVAALALQPSPKSAAFKRRWMASIACVVVSSLSGTMVGVLLEVQRPQPVALMLPADARTAPLALFLDHAGG